MKPKNAFIVMLTILVIGLISLTPALAEGESTVITHDESQITAEGVFPDGDIKLLVKQEKITDNPSCEMILNLTIMVSCEHGDADTYDGYNGVTVSIPYDKSGLNVIGFDYDSNPVDTKAQYKSGKYVFTTDNIGDGVFWLTSQPLTDTKKEITYQELNDASSGVTVKGRFPEGSFLLVRDITEQVTADQETKFESQYYELKVYNQFKEASPDGTVRVALPHKKDGLTVLMEMTMAQIQKLTEAEDDADINYFDRRWFDVDASYKKGSYTFDASRLGTYCVAGQDYYNDIGGGTRRGTPPKEKLEPFSQPTNYTLIISVASIAVLIAATLGYLIVKRKKQK